MATEPLMDQFKQELDLYYRSPESIDATTMDILEQALDEKLNIVDPSSPFIFLLEASTIHTSAAMNSFETSMRRTYPKLASTMDELYNHMADSDLLDRFASPSRTELMFAIPTQVLGDVAVWDAVREVYRVRIPKDTTIRYGGVDWFVHYPIDILRSTGGAVQCAYDFSMETPLKDSDEINLTYRVTNTVNGEMLYLSVPVEQISVDSETAPISPSAPYNAKIPFSDQFYYMRAYHRTDESGWEEMNVTHSLTVYDSAKPTMTVRVADGVASVAIPDIYSVNGSLGDTVRVDIFTTKGSLSLDLSDYSSADASVAWLNVNEPDDDYIEAVRNINSMDLYATATVMTGRDELSFEELKERVIYRSDDRRAAITSTELTYRLADMGYDVSILKDTLVSRIFACKRDLAEDTELNIGVRNPQVKVDTEAEGYTTALRRNGDRVTVKSSAIYYDDGDKVTLLNDTETQELYDNSVNDPESFLLAINEGRYFYSPFFYVLDQGSDAYVARPYYLDRPSILSRGFLDANTRVPFSIYTTSASIARNGSEYVLTLTAETAEGLTGFHGQIQFEDSTGQRYHKNHDSVSYDGRIATFTYNLTTTFDVDQSDRLEFTNMRSAGRFEAITPLPLITTFDVLYLKESSADAPSNFDYMVNEPEISIDWIAATHETIRVQLGHTMEGLFAPSDAIYSTPVYKTYTSDIPMFYSENVYETDENGNWVFSTSGVTPAPQILHRQGDPVLDEAMNPVYVHRRGERVIENGEYFVETPSRLVWTFQPIALDARFLFASTDSAVTYREAVGARALAYLENDLRPLENALAARTELQYLPNANSGIATVEVDSGKLVSMDTALRFTVRYVLTEAGYADEALKAKLTRTTVTTLKSILYQPRLAISNLTTQLHRLSSEVVSVDYDNPIDGWTMATVVSENAVFSLRSVLYRRGDGIYDVDDDVTVSFDKLR